MKSSLFAFCIIVVLWPAGCSSINVQQDYDSSADFSALKTYEWIQTPSAEAGSGVKAAQERNSLLDKRIRSAVDAQLAAKGYSKSSSSPTFYIMYHTGADEKVDVTSYGYGYGYGGGYRYGGYGAAGGVEVNQYTQGTLLLDVIDVSTKQMIWRGTAEGVVHPNASTEEREARINEAVTKVLDQFPPDKGGY